MKHVSVDVRLDASVCNNKQCWNDDKCRCECKELIDKGICDKRFIWNPSNCECECDKSCDIGEYLDYENYKCRKKLVDKLVAKCTENIDEVKIAEITSMELHSTDLHSAGQENVCRHNFCYLGCSSLSNQHWDWCLFCLFSLVVKKDVTHIKFGTCTRWNCAETTI